MRYQPAIATISVEGGYTIENNCGCELHRDITWRTATSRKVAYQPGFSGLIHGSAS